MLLLTLRDRGMSVLKTDFSTHLIKLWHSSSSFFMDLTFCRYTVNFIQASAGFVILCKFILY